jgi:hypothetical protein
MVVRRLILLTALVLATPAAAGAEAAPMQRRGGRKRIVAQETARSCRWPRPVRLPPDSGGRPSLALVEA